MVKESAYSREQEPPLLAAGCWNHAAPQACPLAPRESLSSFPSCPYHRTRMKKCSQQIPTIKAYFFLRWGTQLG